MCLPKSLLVLIKGLDVKLNHTYLHSEALNLTVFYQQGLPALKIVYASYENSLEIACILIKLSCAADRLEGKGTEPNDLT